MNWNFFAVLIAALVLCTIAAFGIATLVAVLWHFLETFWEVRRIVGT